MVDTGCKWRSLPENFPPWRARVTASWLAGLPPASSGRSATSSANGSAGRWARRPKRSQPSSTPSRSRPPRQSGKPPARRPCRPPRRARPARRHPAPGELGSGPAQGGGWSLNPWPGRTVQPVR
ncbi:transposase [Streptomyces griseofuscus]|uniref:transposase n=1 Tax=Streptomyces griseofuscus TaxID=146922 RepID=UPI003F4DDED4